MAENLQELVSQMKTEQTAETSGGSSPQSESQARQETARPQESALPSERPSATAGTQEAQTQAQDGKDTSGSSRRNLNSYSHEDKAAYAFRRQLERQRTESASEMKKRDDRIAELERKLAELTAPKEERKRRDSFETDDEYMEYIADRRANAAVADERKRAEEERRKAAEAEKLRSEEAAMQEKMQARFMENVKRTFGDGDRMREFYTKVKTASDYGLDRIIGTDPVLHRFFFENEDGPAVLERVVDDPASFNRAFRCSNDPLERLLAVHKIADEIHAEAARRNAPELPLIGKPGAGAGNAPKNDMFASSESLSDYIRNRRRIRR